METLRDKIEKVSLITGYAAAALAGITEILPDREHFTSTPLWAVASTAMAAYLINIATNPDPRNNREYNSAFSPEKQVENTSYSEITEDKPKLRIYEE